MKENVKLTVIHENGSESVYYGDWKLILYFAKFNSLYDHWAIRCDGLMIIFDIW